MREQWFFSDWAYIVLQNVCANRTSIKRYSINCLDYYNISLCDNMKGIQGY